MFKLFVHSIGFVEAVLYTIKATAPVGLADKEK